MDTIIQVESVSKRYRLGDEDVWALRGVSLAIARGEFLAIVGPSGSGKSSLFNQIGALDVPTEGRIVFDGQALLALSEPDQARVRCERIGYIFQTYNLIPVMTALQNVMLPLQLRGVARDTAAREARARLAEVGLAERAEHKPAQLSGGQQQRCAIARALANAPAVVLADEPTGNLDGATGAEIVALLKRINRERGMTVICATHDAKVMAAADRVLRMQDGQLMASAEGSVWT